MERSSRSASVRRSARQRISIGPPVNKSVSLFECLSNDILLEIFEYLDGCEIFRSFANLNRRFEHLLGDLPIGLHFDLRSKQEGDLLQYCRNTLVPYRNSIVSLRLPTLSQNNRFFCSDEMGALFFPRLESIVLLGISHQTWLVLSEELMFFPRLYSLSVHFSEDDDAGSPIDIYEPILCFPALKYCHVSSNTSTLSVVPTMPSIAQISSIEQLKLDHYCTLSLLYNILSYLPNLSHITCRHLIRSELSLPSAKIPMVFHRLKSFVLQKCDIPFQLLESLLRQISPRLQAVKINASITHDHFFANQWEVLISDHMPELKEFTLIGSLFNRHEDSVYDSPHIIHQFTSSFWLERGWHLSIEIKKTKNSHKAVFIVQPLQTSWYYFPDEDEQTPPMIVEFLCDSVTKAFFASAFFQNFGHMCTALDINCTLRQLTEILNRFPNVKALKFRFSPNDHGHLIRFIKAPNITQLVLYQLRFLRLVQIFFELCPSIEHLQIDQPQKMNYKEIIYDILLRKANRTIRPSHLCISAADVNQQMVNELKNTICGIELQASYLVECIRDSMLSIRRRS